MEDIFRNYMLEKGVDMKHKRPYLKYSDYFSNLDEYYRYLEEDEAMKHLAPKIKDIIYSLSEVLIAENEILLDPNYKGDLPKIMNYLEGLRRELKDSDINGFYKEDVERFNTSLEQAKEEIKNNYVKTKKI